MSEVTLAQIREYARERADMVGSDFIENPELDGYINRSISSLYYLITSKFGEDYFITESAPIPLVSGQDRYPLPSDFFKMLGVDLVVNASERIPLNRFEFNKRNRSNSVYYQVQSVTEYRLSGNEILLSPTPKQGGSIALWYLPLPAKLVADSDEFDGFNGWEEYVILDVAIKMRQKEESSVEELFRDKQEIIARINHEADNRDANQPARVQDVTSYRNDLWGGRWR